MASRNITLMLMLMLRLTLTLLLASCSTDNKIDCKVTGEKMTQQECDRAADKRSSDANVDKLKNPAW